MSTEGSGRSRWGKSSSSGVRSIERVGISTRRGACKWCDFAHPDTAGVAPSTDPASVQRKQLAKAERLTLAATTRYMPAPARDFRVVRHVAQWESTTLTR